MNKRVVVTGFGSVTPYGTGNEVFKKGLTEKINTVTYAKQWSYLKGLKSLVAAFCPDINGKEIPRKFRRGMTKMSIMATLSAKEAIQMSNLSDDFIKSGRCGCIMGSTTGSPNAIAEAFECLTFQKDISTLTSMSFFKAMSHVVCANIAHFFGITGNVFSTNVACASSLQAICSAYDLIKSGEQDAILCGGAEELHPAVPASFDILEATSINFLDKPHLTPRPFDEKRDGLVCGEGAGVIILEDYDHAIERGANIICEIKGYKATTSSLPITQSDPDQMAKAMNGAIENAKISKNEIDYLNAHATATVHGDIAESNAIFKTFGKTLPVSSLKGYIGHTLGASGAIESIACFLMMQNNIIYPCINLDKIANDCSSINALTKIEHKKINTVIKNAFAFGGINISIIYRRFMND